MIKVSNRRKKRVRKVQFISGIITLLLICIGLFTYSAFDRSTEQEAQSNVVGNESESSIEEDGLTKQIDSSIEGNMEQKLMA